LLSLPVYSAQATPKKQAARLDSNQTTMITTCNQMKGIFKTNIQDNIPNVKIGYSFTKLSFQENN